MDLTWHGSTTALHEHLKRKHIGSIKEELLEQRWHLTATLSDPSITKRGKIYLDLMAQQWGLLEELSTALKPFECATVFMSGEKYITISAVPPLVTGLLKSTQSMVFESARMQAFQGTVIEQVLARWRKETTFSDGAQNTVIISSALDPWFKRLRFLPREEVFNVQMKVQTLAFGERKGHLELATSATATSPSTTTEAAPTSASLLDSLLDSGSSEEESSEAGSDLNNQVKNEIQAYFTERQLAKEENALLWWKANLDSYPTLARLAKSYLCIPGTSTPSEHLFSAAGNIASKKRASLSPEHVDMLTFLHANAEFLYRGTVCVSMHSCVLVFTVCVNDSYYLQVFCVC